MNSCSGCRFCCWSWAVTELKKPALRHCGYECQAGCAVHNLVVQPAMCERFRCPYQERDGFHRPDSFQQTLEELRGNVGNYIPIVPVSIPVERANQLIRDTRTVPAAIIADGQWLDVILPLDQKPGELVAIQGDTVWANAKI